MKKKDMPPYRMFYPKPSKEALRKLKERKVLFLDRHVAEKVLLPEDCMQVLEEAYKEEGLGSAVNRPKSNILIPSKDPSKRWYRYCSMEGGVKGMSIVATRIKSDIVENFSKLGTKREDYYCLYPGRYFGLILLFDSRDGALLAILNDGHIQHMRVAATVALGSKYSAREDSTVLGILGSGAMAWTHANFLSRVRPIEEIRVYSPNSKHRKEFVAQLRKALLPAGLRKIRETEEPREVFSGSDIVAACTNAHEPVLRGKWFEEGMHITINKFRTEPDNSALRRIDRLIVYESPLGVDGTPSETRWTAPPNWSFSGGTRPKDMKKREKLGLSSKTLSLPDVLLGRAQGRDNDLQVTAFTNEGTGVQFAAVALKVYEEAKKRGLGRELPLEWFLQDIPN